MRVVKVAENWYRVVANGVVLSDCHASYADAMRVLLRAEDIFTAAAEEIVTRYDEEPVDEYGVVQVAIPFVNELIDHIDTILAVSRARG